MDKMKKFQRVLWSLLMVAALTGCATMDGAEEDMEDLGDQIEEI